MSLRTERVAALAQKIIADKILSLEPPAITTVTEVSISDDLKNARVAISVLAQTPKDREKVMGLLNKNLKDIQSYLAGKLKTRNTPKVYFVHDVTEEYASHIEDVIKKSHESD